MATQLVDVPRPPLVAGPGSQTFDAVAQHWAKARIDAPLQMIGRSDDTAKQIITVAGVLEGLIVTLAKVEAALTLPMVVFSVVASVCLVGAILFASSAIRIQSRHLQAAPMFDLFQISDPAVLLRELNRQVRDWCMDAERIALRKCDRIEHAMKAFCAGLIALVLCLIVNVALRVPL